MIKKTVRDDQKKLARALVYGERKLLHADCGFGKTITALYAASLVDIDYLIFVAPSNILPKIHKEAEAIDLKTKVITISWNKVPDEYDRLKKLIKDNNCAVVVDECHKFRSCSQTRSAYLHKLVKKVQYLWLLSATPSQNRPSDWYLMLKNCGAYRGNLNDFRIRYCGGYIPYGKNFAIDGKSATHVEELKAMIKSIVVRGGGRKLNLNFKKFLSEQEVVMPKFEETAEYLLDVGKKKFEIFKKLHKAGKIKERSIIFAHHREIVIGLSEYLKCEYIIGGMKAEEKQAVIDKFLKSDAKHLVISIRAGGEGIDIDGIDTCHFVEMTYSPAADRQAYLRLARKNLDLTINICYILLKGEHEQIVQDRKFDYFKQIGD